MRQSITSSVRDHEMRIGMSAAKKITLYGTLVPEELDDMMEHVDR